MIPRSEYPRPQFQRDDFICLNGQWDFSFDDNNKGLEEKWFKSHDFNHQITVPFVFQSKLSGIEEKTQHDVVWYKRSFQVEDLLKTTYLHFGAVDYKATVYLNGSEVGHHEGGHSPFSLDISHVVEKENTLIVRVQDYSQALDLPRGKQYWKEQSESIYYTGTTGIWQSVWLEQVPTSHIKHVYYTPDFDNRTLAIDFVTTGPITLDLQISINGTVLIDDTTKVFDQCRKVYHLNENQLSHLVTAADWHAWEWSPENPQLFDVTFKYEGDEINSYFAFRKVSIVNGRFYLNNQPYYQKLVLDQGYWPEGLLTAPTDEAFIKDIQLTKMMGFNGVRKHQKSEDPRYLYWADKLGLLVWAEAANAILFTKRGAKQFTDEWMTLIERDYNHPSIVAWVPLNESWGVDNIGTNPDQQAFATSLYYLTKTFDQTRMVISNDGWLHTVSDLFTIHDYSGNKETLIERYKHKELIPLCTPANRPLYAPNYEYNNEPIIISEFGGISYQTGEQAGWGYTNATNNQDFIERYKAVVTGLYESKNIDGFCYTQLTDVEQEINGLLTYNREPKVPIESIRGINDLRGRR